MDNIALRARYPRHSITTRKRRKNAVRETGGYKERLAKQIVISVLILMIAGIIRNANTSVTDYICEKLQTILSQNIEIQSVYAGIENVVNTVMRKGSSPGKQGNNEPPEGGGPINGQGYNKENQGSTDTVGNERGTPAPKEDAGQNQSAVLSPTPKPSPTPTVTQASPEATSSQAVNPAATTAKSIFIVPVSGPLGETFGDRIHPLTNTVKPHKGIDIEASQGATIKAAASGEVMEAGYEKTLGNYLKIQHDGSLSTIYAHCSQLLAKRGQKVKQGDAIAKVGSTGLSTGAHLHFEIWKDGKAVDPLGYIKVPEK